MTVNPVEKLADYTASTVNRNSKQEHSKMRKLNTYLQIQNMRENDKDMKNEMR